MSFPNYPDKFREKSFATAKDFWRYKKEIGRVPKIDPPKGVIICYSTTLFNYIMENHPVKKVDYIFGGHFYILDDRNEKIGICGGFGIGAPMVAILLEDFNIFGVKLFLSIGTAGSLQRDLKLGSIVICDKAIRDEGTSHHYLKYEKYSYSSEKVNKKLAEVMESLKLDFTIGATWTIDAPYRETYTEIEKYQKENVLTVDMEAAAMFAVAEYLKLDVGAIFTISDYLSKDRWELHFHLTEKNLQTLFHIAKETIVTL
ncbi:MAG: nucleoside phosphorylase [Promethearchaeota archaeon]